MGNGERERGREREGREGREGKRHNIPVDEGRIDKKVRVEVGRLRYAAGEVS